MFLGGDFKRNEKQKGYKVNSLDYWEECISIAAEECGLSISEDQLRILASAVENGHENYGQAFYSPPSADRVSVIKKECIAKVKEAQNETERIRSDFIKNVCMRWSCDASRVILEGGGHVSILR